MVEWNANGTTVTLRREEGTYVVTGPQGSQGAKTLEQATARAGQVLHQVLAGYTGNSGWSLILSFPSIRAVYGDATPNRGGGGGGPVSDVVRCANAIYDPTLSPHPAIENSIAIVRSCWSAAADQAA
jgi:hypothetical protein